MDCSCNLGSSIDCDDYNGFVSTEDRKARKEWHCCECNELIPVGAVYLYCSGMNDGSFFKDRTCARCKSIADQLFGDRYIGSLMDDLEESIYSGQEIPPSCIAKLTPIARDFVCDLIQSSWRGNDAK